MAAAGGGPCFSAPPLTRLLLPCRRPRSRGELSRRLRPAQGASRFPSRPPPCPAQSLVPVGPAARSLALSGPAAAPITSAAGPTPHRSGRLGSGGPAAEQIGAARGAERGLLPRRSLRPLPCPLPARGGAPARLPPPPPLPGEEGEWSRRRRRRRRCRHGARPRGGRDQPPGRIRPSGLPPATSTPSLAPSLAPRVLPLNRSESAKGGKREKNPPARPRRGGGRGGAERSAEPPLLPPPPPPPPRGTVPGSASRWRYGRGRGTEQKPGLRPPRPRLTPSMPAAPRA
nr:basic proline-rich protein [Oryctolagus cuniculus]